MTNHVQVQADLVVVRAMDILQMSRLSVAVRERNLVSYQAMVGTDIVVLVQEGTGMEGLLEDVTRQQIDQVGIEEVDFLGVETARQEDQLEMLEEHQDQVEKADHRLQVDTDHSVRFELVQDSYEEDILVVEQVVVQPHKHLQIAYFHLASTSNVAEGRNRRFE